MWGYCDCLRFFAFLRPWGAKTAQNDVGGTALSFFISEFWVSFCLFFCVSFVL